MQVGTSINSVTTQMAQSRSWNEHWRGFQAGTTELITELSPEFLPFRDFRPLVQVFRKVRFEHAQQKGLVDDVTLCCKGSSPEGRDSNDGAFPRCSGLTDSCGLQPLQWLTSPRFLSSLAMLYGLTSGQSAANITLWKRLCTAA